MKFSVLIPLYVKNKLDEFEVTLRSIWDEQTLRPDEIVIVKTVLSPPTWIDFSQRQRSGILSFSPLLKKPGGLALR